VDFMDFMDLMDLMDQTISAFGSFWSFEGGKRVNGRFIPPQGGYQDLLSYQRAEAVYDATVKFCADLLNARDRTVDQMVQAARSGKQNIVEGSMASGTSKKTEIKLTNVARASREELLIGYRDFLRSQELVEWPREHRCVSLLTELENFIVRVLQIFRP
jgi:four helix bundle protein